MGDTRFSIEFRQKTKGFMSDPLGSFKRQGSKLFVPVVLFIVMLFVVGRPALAYIDPGTGSYMLQVAIAFLIGAIFTIKRFWKKIYVVLANLFNIKRKDADIRSRKDPH
jgi:hypothetical protein